MQFIDLKTQYLRIKDMVDNNIQTVLNHGQYIMGAEISQLEKELSDYVGVKHCLSCASGTDALLIPLMAWGIGEGDAVFTTPFTFIATAEVISLVGATPVFVDIDRDTFNINPELLDEAIQKVKKEELINGLSPRHVAQIIRRKMTQKVKPSKKVYNRKNKNNGSN